jgi:hypothetical protein
MRSGEEGRVAGGVDNGEERLLAGGDDSGLERVLERSGMAFSSRSSKIASLRVEENENPGVEHLRIR